MVKPGKTNMCEYFKNPDKEPILKMLLQRLNQFGKMDFSCPVQPVNIYMLINREQLFESNRQ